MANLAIKGHATRGKEVIEILEMLGGKNKAYLNGTDTCLVYYICLEGYIDTLYAVSNKYKVFTLEEFLEKFPYKVGDKVIVKGYKQVFEILSMKWCSERNDVLHSVSNGWFYTEELQPYKEETMGYKPNLLQQLKEYFENTPQEVIETEWHEYAKYNEIGPSVEEYLEYVNNIRQPKYPKTHVECCEILYPNENFQTVSQPIKGHNGKKLFILQKLLICRDAYWKIAGDWEPNWEDETDIYYTISYDGVNIKCYNNTDVYSKLAFPTEEMRDAFYENFKDLIETCKELL